jgi:ribosome-associated protein
VEEEEKPSKTQLKRAMHELQALGERLVELNAAQLAEMALPESLSEAIEAARHMTKHEARRRQLQYIGRLMRSADADSIRERLKAWEGVSVRHAARHHRIERWREQLLEDDGALGALASAHPGLDTQYLRALVRNARAERGSGRPPRAYRELFRALRDIIPESQALPGHEQD